MAGIITRCSGCGEVDGCICTKETSKEIVSECCGAAPRGNGDMDTADIGICPDCKEPCDYVPVED